MTGPGTRWYPGETREDGTSGQPWAEVVVARAGYGFIQITPTGGQASSLFFGPHLGLLLDAVSAFALTRHDIPDVAVMGVPAGRGPELRLTREQAQELLPLLCQAVALAMSTQERYSRVFTRDPRPPLCMNCNLGSNQPAEVTISLTCDAHGHVPFSELGTWDQAQTHWRHQ